MMDLYFYLTDGTIVEVKGSSYTPPCDFAYSKQIDLSEGATFVGLDLVYELGSFRILVEYSDVYQEICFTSFSLPLLNLNL
jgi:hypothetical protein